MELLDGGADITIDPVEEAQSRRLATRLAEPDESAGPVGYVSDPVGCGASGGLERGIEAGAFGFEGRKVGHRAGSELAETDAAVVTGRDCCDVCAGRDRPSRLTSVFPEKGRGYVFTIKAAVRRRGGVEAGESINVALHALER